MRDLHPSHIHWVGRGTGTPKDKDEVNKREVCECDGCDLVVYVVYYESIKRELKTKPIYEYRCDKRLKTIAEGSTRLAYTGLREGLEHLKIKTRLISERFARVMGGVRHLLLFIM